MTTAATAAPSRMPDFETTQSNTDWFMNGPALSEAEWNQITIQAYQKLLSMLSEAIEKNGLRLIYKNCNSGILFEREPTPREELLNPGPVKALAIKLLNHFAAAHTEASKGNEAPPSNEILGHMINIKNMFFNTQHMHRSCMAMEVGVACHLGLI